ncbi:MAG TPA: phosphatase PAP2 family protein [Rudaea sp.]|jgi:membrane-associated phospholipid phosphatase
MRLGLLLLLSACGACHAAPDAAGDAWLLDPVGAVLAAADSSASTPPAPAPDGPEGLISVGYLKVIWSDTKEIATAPWHWDRDDWRDFGLIGGGLILTGAFLDKPIRDAAQRNRTSSSDNFFKDVERFGTKQYGLPVLAGFYLYGQFADDYNAKTTALDGLSASVISSVLASTIKGIVGRARPNTGLGPHHFNPGGGDYSFPSGHATGAFAFASVISAHYDDVWVDTTAYTIASLVGVARIHLDAHWASDVIAGGLIGGLIGHHLVEFNRTLRANHDLAPTIGTDGNQLTFSWSF